MIARRINTRVQYNLIAERKKVDSIKYVHIAYIHAT